MTTPPAWLESYATDRFDWHSSRDNSYYRRIGVVESLFDTDGIDHEGRADLSIHLQLAFKTRLPLEAVKAHILLAWSVLREKHVLLSARVANESGLSSTHGADLRSVASDDHYFVVDPCRDPKAMLAEAYKHAVFLQDHIPQVDTDEFFIHTMNTRRCIDEQRALSKLYILPTTEDELHFIFIVGHEICDGLTSNRWTSSFIDLLNLTVPELESQAKLLCSSSPVGRLPAAQETMYPPIKGSQARQRWSWLLTRILRHSHHPAPASFQNPLRRTDPLSKAVSLEPKFDRILDYSRIPPLNTFPLRATLNPRSTKRISRICRDAKISVGSGCFALVAIVMMFFEEKRHPNIPPHQRLPFVGSFPVNPRPFLAGHPTTGKEDSLMLAFSDGITLPFLPSTLDLEGRMRLLGKQAHRQLRQYQKRPRTIAEEKHLGSRSPAQLLPLLYLNTMEYLDRKSQASRKRGWNIQGSYPAKMSSTLATCGVSSTGARGSVLSKGKYDITSDLPEGVDLRADFRGQHASVRARDREFLVGVVGDNDVLRFGVSYDGCAIDPELAEEWKDAIENILEAPLIHKI